MASAPPDSEPEIRPKPQGIMIHTAMLTEIRIGTGFPQLQSDSGRLFVGQTAEWASVPYIDGETCHRPASTCLWLWRPAIGFEPGAQRRYIGLDRSKPFLRYGRLIYQGIEDHYLCKQVSRAFIRMINIVAANV